MTETLNIELKFFETAGHEFQWFLLYEFNVNDQEIFNKSDKEIISEILTTRILNERLYHREMEGVEIELKGLGESPGRPYIFDKLDIDDFQYLSSKSAFDQWFLNFKTEGWKDDREDAQILIGKAEEILNSRTELINGIWHLSKGQFENESDKLIEVHWIFIHFETFVEIDRENKIIRTFDFGYD